MRFDSLFRGFQQRRWLVIRSSALTALLAGMYLAAQLLSEPTPAQSESLSMTQFVWRDDGLVNLGRSKEVSALLEQRILVTRPDAARSGYPEGGSSLTQAGIALGPESHVTISAPFVILTRGAESVMLTRHTERRITADRKLPDWVEQHARPATFVAEFGQLGLVVVDGRSVRVHRGDTEDRSI